MVEQLIRSLSPGEARVSLSKAMQSQPVAKRVAAKLQLSPAALEPLGTDRRLPAPQP